MNRRGEKMKENLQTAIQRAIEEAPERGFVESIEISFTIKDVDLKVPTNRIQRGGQASFRKRKANENHMFAGVRWRQRRRLRVSK